MGLAGLPDYRLTISKQLINGDCGIAVAAAHYSAIADHIHVVEEEVHVDFEGLDRGRQSTDHCITRAGSIVIV